MYLHVLQIHIFVVFAPQQYEWDTIIYNNSANTAFSYMA
nr:MAG TPA: hypothetical protein [Crassvirales sp.]